MIQEAIDYGHDSRVSEAQRRVLRTMNDVVDAVSLMVAAGACGCRTQDLSDALAGRANRYIRIEWVLALLSVCDRSFPDLKMKLGQDLIEWVGTTVSGRPRTAEERLADLELAVVERFGQAGAELVREQRR